MRIRSATLGLLFLWGCGSGGATGPRTITVREGESIQSAVDAAAPGTTIIVEPGVYHESATQTTAVTISKDGIQLIGRSTPANPVVLENAGGQKNGIWVAPVDSVDVADGEHPPCGENGHLLRNFLLKGFTVRNFDRYACTWPAWTASLSRKTWPTPTKSTASSRCAPATAR